MCLISIKSLQKVSNYFHKKKYVLTIIATIVLISSISFLEIKKNDSEHEIEALKIAEIISEKTIAINQYTTESGYLPIIGMKELNEFPITRMDFVNKESNMKNCFNIHACQYIIPIKTNDIVEFLKNSQDKGITHLIIDDKEERRASFNHEIFYNEEKFLYLKKYMILTIKTSHTM